MILAAVRLLSQQAIMRFNAHGPNDARGAALWDAARFLDPDDGNALDLPPACGICGDRAPAFIHISDRVDGDTTPLCWHEYDGHESPCVAAGDRWAHCDD